MKRPAQFITIILMIIALCSSCKKDETPGKGNNDFIVAAYLPTWGLGNVDYESVKRLDILYFFSIAPDADGNFYVPQSTVDDINMLKSVIGNWQTKLFIVVGGWYESETIFPMALDPAKRSSYISSLVNFCIDNDIDGVDLDWEGYPVPVEDSDHLTLVNELSESLHGNGIMFTVAMMLSKYELASAMAGKVDYFNVMGYESFDENGNQVPMSMFEYYLNKYVDAGVVRGKIIMGVPYFGKRKYIEGDSSPLYMKYREIVSAASPDPGVNWYGLYSYNGVNLVKQKTRYLLGGNYAGIMAWELSQDVAYSSVYSLTRAIIEEAGKN